MGAGSATVLGLAGPLAVLALIDSLSFGTLVIPLWLMLAPGRVRAGRLVLFLFTVAGFYLVLGVALAAGALTALDRLGGAVDSTPARSIELAVGIAFLVLGVTLEPFTKAGKARRATRREARQARKGPGRLAAWRERATSGTGSAGALMALGVTAAAIEAASMLPYLGAIGILTASDLPIPLAVAVLAAYCLVMIGPALVLLAGRLLLHERLVPLLRRTEGWMTRNSRETTAWIVFLLGLYLTSDAVAALDA